MNVEELEARIKVLEDQIRTVQDIEEIKKLQRAYGYYLEHGISQHLLDLFSDSPEATLLIAAGEFRGKEGIARFFSRLEQNNPEFLHQVMQLSGIVDVAPDGKTAQGRWYGFGANALPAEGGVTQGWMNGVYENDYVKENGKWKIKKVHWCIIFNAPFKEGWVEPSRRIDNARIDRPQPDSRFAPDGPPEDTAYPSGFICPFHYKNPVTGK
jgi:hypothetical protein